MMPFINLQDLEVPYPLQYSLFMPGCGLSYNGTIKTDEESCLLLIYILTGLFTLVFIEQPLALPVSARKYEQKY